MKYSSRLELAPDVNIVDEDVVEVSALLVAEEGVRHPNLNKLDSSQIGSGFAVK